MVERKRDSPIIAKEHVADSVAESIKGYA